MFPIQQQAKISNPSVNLDMVFMTLKTNWQKIILAAVLIAFFIGVGTPTNCLAQKNDETQVTTEPKSFIESIKLKTPKGERGKVVKEVREWANTPKPPGQFFILCALISVIALGFFPKLTRESQNACKEKFWRCFGRAILTNICLILLFRVFIGAKVTAPLAILFAGFYELLLVAGLAISTCLIGSVVLGKLGIEKVSFVENHPKLKYFLIVLVGCFIMTLIAQTPGIGKLPHIGIRLAILIAALGEGGLLAVLAKKTE